jgi:hypothetical protein
VKYDKDYCARMGWLIWNEKKSESKLLSNHSEIFERFPFCEVLSKWTLRRQRNDKSTDRDDQDDNQMLATVGLYEGENLLFPRISSDDVETVKWLLAQETEHGNSGGER